MQLHEIEQLLDKNLYGDHSSSRRVSPSNRDRRLAIQIANFYDDNNSINKDLYEVLIDLTIFIIVKLAGGTQTAAFSSTDQTDQIDASGDLLSHLVTTFVRHVRQHETLSQREQNQ